MKVQSDCDCLSDLRTYCHLVEEMKRIDEKNYTLKSLVWVNFPLAYTQAKTIYMKALPQKH
jgi:hypothetical protein